MNIGFVILLIISTNVCYKKYTLIKGSAEIPKHTDLSSDISITTENVSQNEEMQRSLPIMVTVPEGEPIQDILAEKSRTAARDINAGLAFFLDNQSCEILYSLW